VEIVERQSSEMEDLVSDLMDLSQLESGTVTIQRERVALDLLVADVLSSLAPAYRARDVAVATSVPKGLAASGDRRRVAQVVRNLIDNAIKFSPKGGRVDVLGESAPDGHAVIHVIDRGVGIPRSEQANVFQRFYRVDPSRAKTTPGTGLGLAIVKHLLILHGGGIEVDSEPGKGSRFTVTLPAAPVGALVSEERK
jgi:two-component system phosphate regulon sensor histidine kinase PhoR